MAGPNNNQIEGFYDEVIESKEDRMRRLARADTSFNNSIILLKHTPEKMDEINYFIDGCLYQYTDFDVALVIAAYFNLDIIDYKGKMFPDIHFSDPIIKYVPKNIWFIYLSKIHRWIETTDSILSNNISTVIYKLFEDRKKYYNKKLQTTEDEAMKDRYRKFVQNATTIIGYLRDSGKKSKYISEVKHLVCDQNFVEKLDTLNHLLGFKNGVYDFEHGVFRDGNPKDYISLSTRYDYVAYNPEDPQQKDLQAYLDQMYKASDVKDYIINVLGMAACCGRLEQFNMMWGDSGANGKSTFVKLLQAAFGDYAKTIPVAIFTQKRASSNSAQAEVERLKGARLITSSEPDDDDVFNLGLMKEFTGNDVIQARGLYKTPVEFQLCAQFFLCCNKFPKIPLTAANDGGTWRRIKVIGHNAYFYVGDKPPAHIKNKEFHKKDANIDKKLALFPPYLMSYIIYNIQQLYPQLEFPIPKSVEYSTNEYQKESDLFRQFLTESVIILRENEISNNNQEKILITNLYSHFLRWLKSNSNGLKIAVDKQSIKNKLLQNGFEISKNEKYVLHCKLKLEQDSDEDEDVNDVMPMNNCENDSEPEVLTTFKHWLKHKFLDMIDITKADDIHNRIPTQYIYNLFMNEYNRCVSVNDTNMIYDILCDYFESTHNLVKKKAKNKIYTQNSVVCICGIRLKEAFSTP